MRDSFPIYDTHSHIGCARHSGRRFTAEEMLRLMDRHGVDRAVLIPFPVVEDARGEHDQIGGAVRGHPDRFTGCACLNPFEPESRFREEVRRCAQEWGFRALKLQPQYHGLNPLSRRSEFFFETALENRLTVIVHTGAGAPFALPSLYIHVARKFPDLQIVLGHAGGGIYCGEAIVAAEVCPNISIELSSLMPHHIEEVLQHVLPSRLMIGSDLPASLDTEIGKIIGLSIAAEQKRQILWNAPRRIFDGEPE